jgi:hypothetical protein
MRPARLIVVTLFAVLTVIGVGKAGLAAPSGTCSSTSLHPGDTITVVGSGVGAGETATLHFNGPTIGASTADGFGNFSVSGAIPSSTVPGVYTVSVTFSASPTIVPCNVTVTPAPSPTPTPTPTPTATPTPTSQPTSSATPPVATFPVFIPITVSQQQQQQQQQQQGGGGGGGGGQGQQSQSGSGGSQQQQQQQQQPLIRDVVTSILPRTGADAKRFGIWGAVLLVIGLMLVRWSRRRRRAAERRALAELPPLDAIVIEGEWAPGLPPGSEFLSEADGVPPVYLEWPERLYLPAGSEPDDEDVLTPAF